MGMTYKFRGNTGAGYSPCVLNDVPNEYVYQTKTRDLTVWQDKSERLHEQAFDVKFSGTDMKLRFKENGITVELNFTPDE